MEKRLIFKDYMKNFKEEKQKGITLIALVVTIIVLLLLAGISIMMLSGPNGLLTMSTKAGEQNILGEESERLAVAYNGAVTSKYAEMDFSGVVTAIDVKKRI